MSQTLNLVPRSCSLTSGLWTGSPLRTLRLGVRKGFRDVGFTGNEVEEKFTDLFF